jgi:hypothetical protein
MDDDFFDFEPAEHDDLPSIDHDSVPDILHRWLTFESEDQQAFLIGEDLDMDLTEVLDESEAVFLVLYLCSMFEINAELTFPDGGGIIIKGDD